MPPTFIGAGPRGYIGFPKGPFVLASATITAGLLAAEGAVGEVTFPLGAELPEGAVFAGAAFLLAEAFDGAGVIWVSGLFASLSYDQANDENRFAGVQLAAGFTFDGARAGGLSIGAPIGGTSLTLKISTPDATLDQLDTGQLAVAVHYSIPGGGPS